jgi:SpoVK/Ycf46/Vps4 family AAA+-type ATPase
MKKWNKSGNNFSLGDITNQINDLPVGVYTLNQSMFGFYLERIDDKFEFNHKLYGLETSLIKRVVKTWKGTDRNLGILLNGLKGTGKTVSAKVICNELELPVILINSNPEGGGIPEFLNQIEQDVIVFIDEYEKIFGEDSELLTVMDGVLTGTSRKLFLLTTNRTYVNDNMLQRPSRIRYFKTFKDLSPAVIEEIVDDTLIHKKFKADTISAISNLEIITIDIVKSIIEEVNLHNESPKEFMDVFNVKKITGKYSIFSILKDENGKETEIEVAKGVKIYPREFDEDRIGSTFQIAEEYFGEIKEIISFDTILVHPYPEEDEDDSPRKNKKSKAKRPDPVVLRIETYDSIHKNFKYSDYGLVL